jgi:hypothetical protein
MKNGAVVRTRIWSLVLLLVLGLIGPVLPSGAAVKEGTACKKPQQIRVVKGVSLKCIKSGKRLVWREFKIPTAVTPVVEASPSPSPTVSAAPVASPSPTPTRVIPAFEPWSSQFEMASMTQAALKNTREFFGEVVPDNSYELMIDPAITSSDKDWITRMLDHVNGAFASIRQSRAKVFLGTTHQWSLEAVRGKGTWIGNPNSPYPCSDGTREAYCADDDRVLLIFSEIYKPNTTPVWNSGPRSTPAHEMFHVVQHWLFGPMNNVGPGNPKYVPTWLKEGSANYYGYYIADRLGHVTYRESLAEQARFAPDFARKFPLAEYQTYNDYKNNIYLNPYVIGQVATEYLIASIGFKPLIDIWKFTKEDGNFEAGFKRATGVTLAEFYERFDKARDSIKIN